jgi:hypothetical protein
MNTKVWQMIKQYEDMWYMLKNNKKVQEKWKEFNIT